MTDWIEHTGDTRPKDLEPGDMVQVMLAGARGIRRGKAYNHNWKTKGERYPITHYRVEAPKSKGPDLVALRLECLKLAVNDHFYEAGEPDYEQVANRFLRYVLNGSVDKA